MKNTICKRCGSLLIPGQTSDIDVISSGDCEAVIVERQFTSKRLKRMSGEKTATMATATAKVDDETQQDRMEIDDGRASTSAAQEGSLLQPAHGNDSAPATATINSSVAYPDSSVLSPSTNPSIFLASSSAPSSSSSSSSVSSVPRTRKRLRRHRTSGTHAEVSQTEPIHIITICRTCNTRKRMHTKPDPTVKKGQATTKPKVFNNQAK